MVLGLINFLLGGKKKTKISKSGQLTTPLNKSVDSDTQSSAKLPDGQEVPTENAQQDMNFKDLNNESTKNDSEEKELKSGEVGGIQKKSISVVIGKIHEELKSTNDKIGEMVSDIRSIENNVSTLANRVTDLEDNKKVSDGKINDIDSNMGKFLSLYELINNQYNPFVDNESIVAKKIEISADGNSIPSSTDPVSFEDLHLKSVNLENSKRILRENDLDSSLLGLDTLNIEAAAGDAVPLTKLKNNTNSLVVILSWLEYLIKKVGIEETRNSLRYYTEVLRWTTPEVFFDLDKYLRGMKDKKEIDENAKLTVKDHIVSLYFISKLNEKTLDEKLTKAVLEIIKN